MARTNPVPRCFELGSSVRAILNTKQVKLVTGNMDIKKILVSLVSEQTIPNILVAAYYKPGILWFISTERMERERKTECIEKTLRLKGLLSSTKNIEKIIVDQDSLTDCINKIESLIEKVSYEVEYIVNITGGNKVMALATYEVFREIGQKVIIDYIPLGKNELVQIFPRKKPLRHGKSKNV